MTKLRVTITQVITLIVTLLVLSACSSQYPNQTLVGQTFPQVNGETLTKQKVVLPQHFNNQTTILLIGYVQDSQFDIDRWLIALDMTEVTTPVFELPTIKGMLPRMFETTINNGMRKGIPKELWQGVITIYQDGDKIQRLTGNQNPNNARVVLLNRDNNIVYFYDRGFSVSALNELRTQIDKN
ncbi:hypothetical protein J7384_02720 [Endozoicomonas sp. G2_1]|uniref:hypothetical protein n=1 Tax=Endozoicomonas sp. G2_1 TaxID=2821091 RepID=UPI001ADC4594|nr:hypothetical protein [Endozoicomonas sp. G2_1]MBO9489269.1 hypothetical protein [Endozoicomonas sp. G2_1]